MAAPKRPAASEPIQHSASKAGPNATRTPYPARTTALTAAGRRRRGGAGEIAVTLAPNAEHKDSDLAYQLLGAIVTRASGVPYPHYVQEAILRPLGMAATGFAPLSAGLPGRRATGYDWRALSDELDPAPAMPPVWAEAWGISWCATRQDDAVWIGHSGGVPGLTGERARFQRLPGGQVRSVLLMDTTWERLEPAG
jgi:CubicO group peptidase (beta-lactamase class C family)